MGSGDTPAGAPVGASTNGDTNSSTLLDVTLTAEDIDVETSKITKTIDLLKSARVKRTSVAKVNDAMDQICECFEQILKMNSKVFQIVNKLQCKIPINDDTLATPRMVDQPSKTKLASINERVDSIEQSSLSCAASCHGDVVSEIISEINEDAAEGTAAQLKGSFIKKIRDVCSISLNENDVASVVARGKDKKLLKIEFTSRSSKLDLIQAVRRLKPDNLFLNDYLTRSRAMIFYKLRQLKKTSQSLVSVFSVNGSLKCKLLNSDKYIYVSTEREFGDLKSKITSLESNQ